MRTGIATALASLSMRSDWWSWMYERNSAGAAIVAVSVGREREKGAVVCGDDMRGVSGFSR